jgi:hypothetical protein
MAKVVGEATASGKKQQLLQALQDALKNAPPPTKGDIQHFKLLAVELEYGGFVGSTRTRVTLDVKNGPLK